MMKKIFVALAVAAFAVAASGASAATYNFTRDLTVGSTGADVVALQDILISGGYLVIPAGVSKGYFGGLTQAAVAKWQASAGVAPAAGYFGPKSRAALAASGSTGNTGDNSGSSNDDDLDGGDGDFKDFDLLGNPSNETVDEDDSEEVIGFEFEADDSDLRVERVEVLVNTSGSAGTDNPWDVVESASLMYEGKEVATIDGLDDEDEWDEEDDDQYVLRFEDVDSKVEEGDTVEFTVEFTAQNNLDSGDVPAEFTLLIPRDGVRAVNGEGIDVYAPSSNTDTVDVTFDQADAGDVELSLDEDENEDRVEFVDEDTETDEVEVLRFTFESKTASNQIQDLDVDFATTTATTTSLATVIKNVTLLIDGEEVDSDNLTASSSGGGIAEFEDIDFDVDEDEEVEVVVMVELEAQEGNYGEGYEFVASVNGANMEVEDSEGDDVTVSDSVEGGDIELRVNGLNVEFVSEASEKTFTADDAGENDRVQYTLKFKVTAEGDDVFIDKDIQNLANGVTPSASGGGIAWATTTESTGSTTQILATFTASGSTSGDSGTAFKIAKGNSRTFTLNVELEAPENGTTDATAAIQITGINFDTDGTVGTDYYTTDLEDFKTDPPVSLNSL